MKPRERNKNTRYLRIKEMERYLRKERRFATDFIYQAIGDFFGIEEQTITFAIKSEVVGDSDFKAFDLDKKWLDDYVKRATAKQEKRNEKSESKTLFDNELS